MKDCGVDGNCLFMLEVWEGYYFIENYIGDFIKEIIEKDVMFSKKYIFGMYGYFLIKFNYEIIFIVVGKGIKSGVIVLYMRFIDEGLIIVRLFGLYLGEIDGVIVEDLF